MIKQVVHTSLSHCATWGAALIMPPLCYEFGKLRGLERPEARFSIDFRLIFDCFPTGFRLISVDCQQALVGVEWLHAQPALYGNYITRDGACILFSPASPAKTIAAVKAFGLMGKAVPKVRKRCILN